MEETTQEKLGTILDEHYEHTKETAKKILEELKIGRKSYGELNKTLEIFKKSIFFYHADLRKYECVFIEIERMLEEEMNGLPLTNRS